MSKLSTRVSDRFGSECVCITAMPNAGHTVGDLIKLLTSVKERYGNIRVCMDDCSAVKDIFTDGFVFEFIYDRAGEDLVFVLSSPVSD